MNRSVLRRLGLSTNAVAFLRLLYGQVRKSVRFRVSSLIDEMKDNITPARKSATLKADET